MERGREYVIGGCIQWQVLASSDYERSRSFVAQGRVEDAVRFQELAAQCSAKARMWFEELHYRHFRNSDLT